MAKDAFYFSHDSNAKDDPKIVMLIEQLGLEGYGIFWVLIETLRDQPNYKYPMALLPAMARRYNTTYEKMKAVVCGYKLFQIDDNEEFFSISLLERMQKMELKREQAKQAIAKRWEKQKQLQAPMEVYDGNTDVIRTYNGSNTNKRKESKVKENTYEHFFENVWKLYPLKKGKARITDATKKKLFEHGFEAISKCIERYNNYIQRNNKEKYIQHGSTFFTSGYVDYLDENYKEDVSLSTSPYRYVP